MLLGFNLTTDLYVTLRALKYINVLNISTRNTGWLLETRFIQTEVTRSLDLVQNNILNCLFGHELDILNRTLM